MESTPEPRPNEWEKRRITPLSLQTQGKRAPEPEGPCTGASDAAKVLPLFHLTPLLDASDDPHVFPASLSVSHHNHLCFSPLHEPAIS